MPIIKNNLGEVVSESKAISAYFKRPEESITNFFDQLKKLTPEAKTELAVGAAKELGWTM